MTKAKKEHKLGNALRAMRGGFYHSPRKDAATQERVRRWINRLKGGQ